MDWTQLYGASNPYGLGSAPGNITANAPFLSPGYGLNEPTPAQKLAQKAPAFVSAAQNAKQSAAQQPQAQQAAAAEKPGKAKVNLKDIAQGAADFGTAMSTVRNPLQAPSQIGAPNGSGGMPGGGQDQLSNVVAGYENPDTVKKMGFYGLGE